jgi:hypothetical protein
VAESYDFYQLANQPVQAPDPVQMSGPTQPFFTESQIQFGSLNINPSWTQQFFDGWTKVGNMGFDLLAQAADISWKEQADKRKKDKERREFLYSIGASGQFSVLSGRGSTNLEDFFGPPMEFNAMGGSN